MSRNSRRKAKRKQSTPPREKKPHYARGLLWAVVFAFIPWGYNEVAGGQTLVRIVIGWILWLIPLSIGFHLFFRWLTEKQKGKKLALIVVSLGVVVFLYFAGESIRSASKPSFFYIFPGLVMNTGESMYYMRPQGSKSLHNINIYLDDKGQLLGTTYHIAQLDQRPGGVFEYLVWKVRSTDVNYIQHLNFIVQSAEIDFVEQLIVQSRGTGLFPKFYAKVISRVGNKLLFECRSKDMALSTPGINSNSEVVPCEHS